MDIDIKINIDTTYIILKEQFNKKLLENCVREVLL